MDQLTQELRLPIIKNSVLLVVVLLETFQPLRKLDLIEVIVEVLSEYIVRVSVVVEHQGFVKFSLGLGDETLQLELSDKMD